MSRRIFLPSATPGQEGSSNVLLVELTFLYSKAPDLAPGKKEEAKSMQSSPDVGAFILVGAKKASQCCPRCNWAATVASFSWRQVRRGLNQIGTLASCKKQWQRMRCLKNQPDVKFLKSGPKRAAPLFSLQAIRQRHTSIVWC